MRPAEDVVRLRRSVLYVPASNARALAKARTLPADALVLDLEDAVAPQAKPAARSAAVAAVGSGAYGRLELTVRCNGLDTPWGRADLAAVATSGAAAVVVPKVTGPASLEAVLAVLDDAGAPPGLAVWVMVETPTAVLDVRELARAPRVAALVLGTNDLAKELRAALLPGRTALLPHLTAVLLAGREAGLAVLDGVWGDVRDLAGLEAECRQAAELGFDGKTLVHPDQVAVANRVWTPTPEQVAHARRVLDAVERARAAGSGVATVDGRMVEGLHADLARRTLAGGGPG